MDHSDSDGHRTILDAAKDHLPRVDFQQIQPDVEGFLGVSIPEGSRFDLMDLERFRTEPHRIRAAPTFEDMASFADYITAFDHGAARVFASLERRMVVAEIDYHDATPLPALGAEPSWRTHKAEYPVRFDPRFEEWSKRHDAEIGQKDFGWWLEDRAADVVTPDGADVIEAARNFETKRDVTFKAVQNIDAGTMSMAYEEEDRPSGSLTVPRALMVRLPIFYGGREVDFDAKLYYRLNRERGLMFKLRIVRLAELLDREFEAEMERLKALLPASMPLHRGVVPPAST